MTTVILFIFGAIIGSFLNVVALRFDTGRGVGGRSSCPGCGRTLKWWELIPIISYIFLQAHCSQCKNRISIQYPLVELWTGLIFITVPLYLVPVFCLFVVITIYDYYHKIIPDSFIYPAIALAIFIRIWMGSRVLDWLAGPIIFLFFALLFLLSKGRAVGFGDAKLGLGVGLLLGAAQGFSAVILGFWIGSLVAIFLMIFKKFTMKSEVPFAPFLVLGTWLAFLVKLDLLHVSLF